MMYRSLLRRQGRLALVLLVIIGLVSVTLLGISPQARANINPKIKVTITELVKSTTRGEEEPGQVYKDEYLKMKFTWDATAADPQPNEQFKIDLPSHFINHEFPQTKSLIHKGLTVGSCQVEERSIICTFNDEIAGKGDAQGDGSAVLRAIEITTTTSSSITVNGEDQLVPNPGDGPIQKRTAKWNPQELYKYGEPVKAQDGFLLWSVGFGGEKINEYFGGAAPRTVVFEDVIADGHIYDDSDTNLPRLNIGGIKTNPENWTDAAYLSGSSDTTLGTYTISEFTVAPDKKSFRIAFTGDWNADYNYIFYYRTKPLSENGKIQPGFKYANTIKLLSTDQSKTEESYYSDSFTISITLKEGFGTFSIEKFLRGNAAFRIPSGVKYPVKVAWKLPAGKTVNDYPTWTAPANPYIVEIAETGKTIQPDVTFPAGTVLTFTEDTSSLPANLLWETPQFVPDSLTIENKQSAKVALTNTVYERPQNGTFKVRKTVTGVAPGNATFTFAYTCSDGQSGQLSVPANGIAVSPEGKTFPEGVFCEVTEDAADAQGKFPGFRLEALPPTERVQIRRDGSTQTVSFVNEYVAQEGGFNIRKIVQGDAPAGFKDPAKKFIVTATCDGRNDVDLQLPGDGTAVPYPEQLPAGTVCTVKEKDANAAPAPYANITTYPNNGTVTIVHGQTGELSVVNTYVLPKGTFAVKKTVVGDNGTAQNKSFTFNYSCVNSATGATETGPFTVPGDGSIVLAGRDFPIGTTCTVTEDAASAALNGGYTHTPVAAQKIVISADSATAPLAFVNTYTEDRGSLKVTKKLLAEAGIEVPANGFPIGYECTDGTKGAGQITEDTPLVVADIKAGAVCTVTEGNAEINGYTLGTTYTVLPGGAASSKVTIVKDQETTVEVKNEYTPKKGAFSVTKTVQGDAGALVADKNYEFEYVCVDAKGKQTARESFTLKNGQVKHVTDVREGTCTVTEKDAGVNNTDLTTVYLIDGTNTNAQEAQVTVKQGATPAVTVRNTYNLHRGDFAVVKDVKGEDAAAIGANKQFSFSYSCSDGTKGVIDQVKGDGKAKAAGLALPVGTTCEVSEHAQSAAHDHYDVAISKPVTVTIGHNAVVEAAFTNTYTHHYGTFSVAKTLKGAKAPAKVFTFTYACTDGSKGSVEAKGNGVPVEAGAKFRTGTSCTVTEDLASAAIEGYTLTAPKPVTVKITQKDQVVGATFVNTYTEDLGSLVLTKALVADAGFKVPAEGFSIAYNCTDGSKGVKKIADKESATIRGIKAKAVCTISEVDAERAGYDLTTTFTVLPQKEESAEVTIVKDQDVSVQVTNTYVRHVGTFSLVKTLKGATAANKVFAFDYVCSDGTKGTLKVKGDGVAVDSGLKLPTGTSCTITEDTATASITGYTLSSAAPVTITISEKDQQVVANFVNTYTEIPTPKIARTGANTLMLALVAGAALVLGGVASVLIRRKR